MTNTLAKKREKKESQYTDQRKIDQPMPYSLTKYPKPQAVVRSMSHRKKLEDGPIQSSIRNQI